MPQKSPFIITLTNAEQKILQQRARKYTLPYSVAIRVQMTLLAAQGLPNNKIAARLSKRREVVSKWRKRFFHERLPSFE